MKPYKEGDPELEIIRGPLWEKGEEFDPIVFTNLPKRPYVLGYTGRPMLSLQFKKSVELCKKIISLFLKATYQG